MHSFLMEKQTVYIFVSVLCCVDAPYYFSSENANFFVVEENNLIVSLEGQSNYHLQAYFSVTQLGVLTP